MAEGFDIESLDVPETEILNEPAAEPAPQTPPTPAEAQPVVETAERVRDPATGQFVAQAPASAPDPATAQPQPAAQAPAEPAKPAEPRVVPLQAYVDQRRQFERELADRDRKLDEVNARIAKLEPQAKEPDFVEDPKGYVDAKTQAAQTELKQLKEEAQQLQQQQQFAQFINSVGSQEAVFVEQNPDYYDAINHIRGVRTSQLTDLYPEATPEQIRQAIAQEEIQAAAQFMRLGKNPAEVAYKMAKTYGYAKKAAAPAVPKIDVPKAPVADPSQTLGSGGGEGDPDEVAGDEEFTVEAAAAEALRERFGTRG